MGRSKRTILERAAGAEEVGEEGVKEEKEGENVEKAGKGERVEKGAKRVEDKEVAAFETIENFLLRILFWKRRIVAHEERITRRKIREILLYVVFLTLFTLTTVISFAEQDFFRIRASVVRGRRWATDGR
jgi:hypothetical protein